MTIRVKRLYDNVMHRFRFWGLATPGLYIDSDAGSTSERFNPDIFSHRRIVVAPMVCLAGYLMIIGGILYRHDDK